ncbi:unnamed protein product, partial [Meganyctiphanes norvegica]
MMQSSSGVCQGDGNSQARPLMSRFNRLIKRTCINRKGIRKLASLPNLLFSPKKPKKHVQILQNIASLCNITPYTRKHHKVQLSQMTSYEGKYLSNLLYLTRIEEESYFFNRWICNNAYLLNHNDIRYHDHITTNHLHSLIHFGTFITEWKPGATICEKLLENDETLNRAVQNLVKIAQHYKFEGWLINIENEIKPHQVDQLVKFSKMLTEAMHEISSQSLVLWYDSVIKDGKLIWQNELNDLNKCFFNVCDGIFLNYTWTEQHLHRSKLAAGKRFTDVYVGLDVFGRNFYEGGGFNTHLALELARKYDLSAAIFAQGWTFETKEYDEFFQAENKLWSSLSPFLKFHGPVDLPFKTSFCQGFGEKVFKKGEVCTVGSWQHLGKMQHQPLWLQEDKAAELGLCTDVAYNGGGCLKLATSKSTSIRLFACEINWIISLLVTLTYKIQETEKIEEFYLVLNLHPRNAEGNKIKDNKIIKLQCNNGEGNKSLEENIRDSNVHIVKPVVNVSEVKGGGEWRCLTFDVAEVEGFYCEQITVEFIGSLTIFFGQLDIRNRCIKGIHTNS